MRSPASDVSSSDRPRPPSKVVDASALAALLFGEPAADAVAGTLGTARLAAPTLLRYEVASVCLKKSERYPKQRSALLEALDYMERLQIDEVQVPPGEAVALARRFDVTVDDAAYLWLARLLDAELVTLDRSLREASRRDRPGHP